MSIGQTNSTADVSNAQRALLDLCKHFGCEDVARHCQVVEASEVPSPANELLVHQKHMTVELERHHGRAVKVNVLQHHLEDDLYTRKINLYLDGSDRVVECGIARIDLNYVSPAVREEILAQKTPLGAILIRHNVHRRIEPKHFLRFSDSRHVFSMFDCHGDPGEVYGRLGTIYCDNQPSIDLLEIVVNTKGEEQP